MSKSLMLLLAAVSTISLARAESALSKLPFGIIIGVTKNSEIENKGICEERIKVTDSYYRCEKYKMAGGKFTVFSSQNEIVNKVSFSGSTSNLPLSWQKIGLKIIESSAGLPPSDLVLKKEQLLTIIQDNGGTNITSANVKIVSDIYFYTYDFDIDNYHYQTSNSITLEGDYGLKGISITEAY